MYLSVKALDIPGDPLELVVGGSSVKSMPSSVSEEKASGLSRSGTADRSLFSSRFTCAAPSLKGLVDGSAPTPQPAR